MTEVVTGEAVRLDLRAASFGSRAVSGAIDLAVGAVVLIVLAMGTVALGAALDTAAATALGLVLFLAVAVGLPVTVETLTRGRTLGKLAMGLRAVRDDGGPIRFRHALVRGLVGFVEVWLLSGVPALISSLVSGRGKRLGDVASGCYVIRERGVQHRANMAQLPPHLAGWAGTADIGRLPDGMALAVRQFLGRTAHLHAASRDQLGRRLAGSVSPYVAPAPPTGTHPEDFLAAVLAERRRRDVERLARERLARERLAEVDAVDAALDATLDGSPRPGARY
jgi:uncharacterized RDD family membrane protein YckC